MKELEEEERLLIEQRKWNIEFYGKQAAADKQVYHIKYCVVVVVFVHI